MDRRVIRVRRRLHILFPISLMFGDIVERGVAIVSLNRLADSLFCGFHAFDFRCLTSIHLQKNLSPLLTNGGPLSTER